MDRANSYIQIILTVNGGLLLMVGYFINRLVAKVDDTAKAISNIDKSVAVMAEKTKQHEARFEYFENFEVRVDKEMKSVRERLHEYGNDLNSVRLHMEGCKMRGK